MIKPNWEIFSAKFSNDKESTFEWFSYLLFCREFNLTKGWFGFKNQSGIEKNPVEDEGHVIGFQAKFYSNSLSEHKNDFLDMLDKAKRDYPELTKILIYTNQLWGQAPSRTTKKMTSPKALLDIETKASKLNIKLEWREASFFESEFVCLEHDDLSKYFFTEQALQGWQRFDDWSNTKTKIEEEYFVDDDIKIIVPHHKNDNELNVIDGINDVRKKLNIGSKSVRLVGLSGVGKTRFAQALFDERIGESNLDARAVWYCDIGDSPNPLPEHFIEELKSKNKHFILIVDNCGQDTHANLTKKIQNTEITLLTIEYDVKDDLPERTDVYKLQPNSTEIIKKVIERHHPDVNDINSRKIAEFSGGNYRLALAIASNIEKTDNLALLTDSKLFERLFWQKGQKSDELFKIAKNFALVYSFNIEDSGQENSELDFLANLSKVDTDAAIEAIETLKTKDIIQQRGKWRALLPHALANHLAKELISKKLVSQLDQLIKQMPARLKTSFIKRLSYLHDVPKVKELVDHWFSNDGWLGKKILNGSYDSDDLVKIRLLSSISEDKLIQLIEQKHVLDKKFLTRENPNYVEISRLIRFLAYEERNFKKAFELLLYFAKDEKENERNNSIRNLITSLFQLYSSETSANLEIKKDALNLLKSDPKHQPLLLSCLSKALNFHGYGNLVLAYNESGKNLDFGYQPRTSNELWSWVIFLLEILNELDIQHVSQARAIFIEHLKEIIWTCRKIDIASDYLNKFNSRSYFSEAHTKILNIIHWNTEELKSKSPQLLKDLKKIENTLRPKKNNISELIKSYILISDHDLYRMTKNYDDVYALQIPEFDNYQDLIKFIENQLQDIKVIDDNLEILIKSNLTKSFIVKMGENCAHVFKDTNNCINSLKKIKIDESILYSDFLLGILKYFKNKSIQEYHHLTDYLVSDQKFKNLVTMIIFLSSTDDSDYFYLKKLLETKKIVSKNGFDISWHKYHKKITNKQFEIILDYFIKSNEDEIVKHELTQECFFHKKVNNKYKNILLNFSTEIISDQNMFNHYKDVLTYLLEVDDYTKNIVFNNIKESFNNDSYIPLYQHNKNFEVLKLLIKNDTQKFFHTFIDDLKFRQRFFMEDLKNIFTYANQQDVLSWIDHDQEKIYFLVKNSRLYETNENKEISLCEDETEDNIIWLDLVFDLLYMSHDKTQILQIILNNQICRMHGVFSGSWSQAMRTRLPYLYSFRNKLKDIFPELLKAIDIKEKEWLDNIDNQFKKDESEEKMKSERFDW